MFRKYDSVCRYDKEEVEGILNGCCYIFEKIDGANCSLYWDEENGMTICSRNNIVYTERHGGNFRGIVDYVSFYPEIKTMLQEHPHCIFYGEWLCKHSLQYPTDKTNKIWFFDIYDTLENKYIPYEEAKDIFSQYKNCERMFLSPLAIINNPRVEELESILNINTFGAIPKQEGIVIKRYDFINKFGITQWSKIVNSEFKEVNKNTFCYESSCCKSNTFTRDGKFFCMRCEQPCEATKVRFFNSVEEKICEDVITQARIIKIIEKIRCIKIDKEQNTDVRIDQRDTAQVLQRAWYDAINEEIWNILKEYKNPSIDFKKLHKLCTEKTKRLFFELIRR